MNFAPEIAARLEQFRVQAESKESNILNAIWIEIQARSLSGSLIKQLHQVMYAQAHEKKWDVGEIRQNVDKLFEEYAANIHTYIKTIMDATQFRTYEKLFSLWHIFHIPLVYMLVFSGIYHVISVHMY